jgi:hypothetical protein
MMKAKQIIAGISAATVLTMVTAAYAGGLGGGAGALGGPMTGGIGGMTGQGAFDGRGAASTSFERFPERPMPRAKPATTGAATTGADSAQRTSGTANALRGSAAHEADGSVVTALGQASGQSSSATNAAAEVPSRAAPAPASKTPSPTVASPSAPAPTMTSATGAGGVDAQHSRGDRSVAVSGDASGSVSRTQ